MFSASNWLLGPTSISVELDSCSRAEHGGSLMFCCWTCWLDLCPLFPLPRIRGSWTSPTSASTSTTPREIWTLTDPFRSASPPTSLSSWPPSASPGRSPPPWSPWPAASPSPTSRYHQNQIRKALVSLCKWSWGDQNLPWGGISSCTFFCMMGMMGTGFVPCGWDPGVANISTGFSRTPTGFDADGCNKSVSCSKPKF